MCVCKWSWLACVFTVPDEDCDDCDSLINAALSYIAELIRQALRHEADV